MLNICDVEEDLSGWEEEVVFRVHLYPDRSLNVWWVLNKRRPHSQRAEKAL